MPRLSKRTRDAIVRATKIVAVEDACAEWERAHPSEPPFTAEERAKLVAALGPENTGD